jgi:hypothetical protein
MTISQNQKPHSDAPEHEVARRAVTINRVKLTPIVVNYILQRKEFFFSCDSAPLPAQ